MIEKLHVNYNLSRILLYTTVFQIFEVQKQPLILIRLGERLAIVFFFLENRGETCRMLPARKARADYLTYDVEFKLRICRLFGDP